MESALPGVRLRSVTANRRRPLLAGSLAALIAADAARLRRRRAALPVIPAAGGTEPAAAGHAFLVAAGVGLDHAQRRAASAYAEREGLDVVDLVPFDLPGGRRRDLLRRVDPATYTAARIAPGQGAFQALLVRREVLDRAQVKEREDFTCRELVAVTARLKRYASASTGIAVLPGLRATPVGRREYLGVAGDAWAGAVGMAAGRPPAALVEARRAEYAADIAAGVERYLEPRRDTCPWCGSLDLAHQVTGRDLGQGKPGTFRYDRCRGCGHVFQNPRLSPAGLEFYYRDFYDGLGEARMEAIFGAGEWPYVDRAGLLPAGESPVTWLDVGGGHGHFCAVARGLLPRTRFDVLDQGEAVEEAVRRRWADRAYRGAFPDLAPALAGRYDVVSMFHYLEHVREPLAELDAVRTALRPGGHVVIEVPNPESLSGRLLRGLWAGWLIPQHQHMIPSGNLLEALSERGFSPVQVHYGTRRPGGATAMAVYFQVQRMFPDPRAPWRSDRLPRVRAALRTAAMAAAVPLMAAGLVVDVVIHPVRLRGHRADVYRVVARRDR